MVKVGAAPGDGGGVGRDGAVSGDGIRLAERGAAPGGGLWVAEDSATSGDGVRMAELGGALGGGVWLGGGGAASGDGARMEELGAAPGRGIPDRPVARLMASGGARLRFTRRAPSPSDPVPAQGRVPLRLGEQVHPCGGGGVEQVGHDDVPRLVPPRGAHGGAAVQVQQPAAQHGGGGGGVFGRRDLRVEGPKRGEGAGAAGAHFMTW